MPISDLKQFFVDLEDEAGFDDITIDASTRSRVGDTPLHIASLQGKTSIVIALLKSGAEIDAAGEAGYTALHYAVTHGHIDTVRALVSLGCDTELRFFDGEGQSALELAAYTEDIQLKSKLVAALMKNGDAEQDGETDG